MTALKEHIAYSAYYLWGCENGGPNVEEADEIDEDCDGEGANKPLGSMQDALSAAENHLTLLDSQLKECGALVSALEQSMHLGTTLHQSTFMVFDYALYKLDDSIIEEYFRDFSMPQQRENN